MLARYASRCLRWLEIDFVKRRLGFLRWLGRNFTRHQPPSPTPGETLGDWGERYAARYLRKQGMHVLMHGVRNGLGEIDFVAVDDGTIVFIEVKTRRSHDKGHPLDAVDATKQRRISRAAAAYLRRHHLLDYPARFDVIAITLADSPNAAPDLIHVRNAFEPAEPFQMFL